MQPAADIRFDVASALNQGNRAYQEDAVILDFPIGAGLGLIVLSDGMGGHAAGDVASKIVMTEVFTELKFRCTGPELPDEHVCQILREAADAANDCLRDHVNDHPEADGMGATLVAAVVLEQRLYWISIGDSPLYLYRNNKLKQLNEDHSMGPQIDFMVESGMMDQRVAENHPDRNCLTSVLSGDEIARVDCPEVPLKLRQNDLLIVASDGLQFLNNRQIARVLASEAEEKSTAIAQELIDTLDRLDDPDQDNVSMALVRVALPEQEVPPVAETPETTEKSAEVTQLHARKPAAEGPSVVPRRIARPEGGGSKRRKRATAKGSP